MHVDVDFLKAWNKICSCLCNTAEFMDFINLSWQRCRTIGKRCERLL